MKELQYPFDAEMIIENKKKIKRKLLCDSTERVKKKIAILGGYTTSHIRMIMELFLLDYGIESEFYESEYNQFYQEAVFDNMKLEEFRPDIVYICTSNRNIKSYPSFRDSEDDVSNLIENEKGRFIEVWEEVAKRYRCPIIQNNFEMPYYRLLGNADASDMHGKVNFLTRLNLIFYEYAQRHDNLFICDINYISADYGLKAWGDPFYYYMYKQAVNVNAIPYLAFNVSNIIKSIFGRNKKAIVLDLDNTLWGGVIGEDGVNNISIGPETAVGQAYSEFQKYIKENLQLGVLLCVDSKNEEEYALKGLEHPDSILHTDDFVCIKANWESKDRNFKEIADNINLLPESLLFVDDNPAERHIVTGQFQEVIAPEIGEVHQYIHNIDRGGYFETTIVAIEDSLRNEMYKSNAKRAEFQSGFEDYAAYLLSLKMKSKIKQFEDVYMNRIAQLINKSNQFNLTTHRYSREEIETFADDSNYITLYGNLSDVFGDNGVVSVVIGKKIGCECRVELWVMSCRVLKRGMEYAMMDTLVERCRETGIRRIHGYYYPTPKNNMVKSFYERMGFDKIEEDQMGNTEWILSIDSEYENKNMVIKVEDE